MRKLIFCVALSAVVNSYAQSSQQVFPPDLVPYHVHADLVEALSNLVTRVEALEAREKRIQAAREAARKRAAANVPRKKKINELNAKLKSRYPAKEAK